MIFQNAVTGYHRFQLHLATNRAPAPGRRPTSQLLQSARLRIRVTPLRHAWRRFPVPGGSRSATAAPDPEEPH
jgi:hypothetical protein